MPKATFQKLPPAKRDRFVAAALEEFASHAYDTASISRIVATLGIAKGSVYQYFRNKLHLFGWLVEESARRELQWHRAHPPPDDVSLEGQLRWMYAHGLGWIREEPRWARVALRALEGSKDPRFAGVREAQFRASVDFLGGLISEGQARGEVRQGLDVELLVRLLTGVLGVGLVEAFLARGGLSYAELVQAPDLAQLLGEQDALAIVAETIDFVMHGIGSR